MSDVSLGRARGIGKECSICEHRDCLKYFGICAKCLYSVARDIGDEPVDNWAPNIELLEFLGDAAKSQNKKTVSGFGRLKRAVAGVFEWIDDSAKKEGGE